MKLFDEHNFIQQLSIDCVIFGYKEKELKVLISKVKVELDIYTLPGGFIKQEESIDEAAKRILEERTGLKDIFLEQYRVFGEPFRINHEIFENINSLKKEWLEQGVLDENDIKWLSKRFVSIGYYALVDINKVSPQKGLFDESVDWYNVKELPSMIMDHNKMVQFALETLRLFLDQKLIGFNLLPETFTIREVQELYEAVYDKPFARNNFQKKILDLDVLERLEKKFTGAANKAPYLYRFRN
ncbi:NUDIX hydrolase [Emticicia oligotrophica DSM 17448]|uniref:NUDIX hydrolase n=1 Tax=Emticicia oligotrophica (strain DSM 17448 / CIP 109782 / MTCC 6937 / GPTSA100-15) TaxID=929562 RepID=A0ABM5N1R9_EMTOG|nr:NUDIX domain-containing protein [Emticicia oligotrophica]AFK03349.1 NUDIX hydrolase [Emticicia oligotrophica DSM 17448]